MADGRGRGPREKRFEQVRTGDRSEFGELFERHRRELQVHCYRMLGSFTESEDLVQETFTRAWSSLASFETRASLRTWLYRIATNACLDVLRQRRRRLLPFDVVPPAGPDGPPPVAGGDVEWLEPFPDTLLATAPDEAAVTKETIELAFLAAVQHLSPVQRAVLILRDVLGWSARETAEALETTEAAVKSALQRARPTLRARLPRRREQWGAAHQVTEEDRLVLRRYIEAFERNDERALAAVLREDVRVSYPQVGMWCDNAETFITGSREHAPPGEYRFVAASANLQPAVAIYLKPPGEAEYRLTALEVLRVEDGRIAEIVDFDLPDLYPAFGLAVSLP